MKQFIFAILVSFVVAFLPSSTHAQTHEVTYDFNFFLKNNSKDIETVLDIRIENLRPDVYVDEFSLNFPTNFFDGDLAAEDLFERIPYKKEEFDNITRITFEFKEPEKAGVEHYLKLKYIHNNLFSTAGSVTEAILPLVNPEDNSKVNVVLHLPENFDEKISVSKPKPTKVEFKKIVWEDVNSRTIFTLFGESQVYKMDLSYTLINNRVINSTQTIALPPDTLFQRLYIESIEPKPSTAYIDEDGNYLAEYKLKPRERIDIDFNGYVEVFVKPQDSLREHTRQTFTEQKKYLLTEQKLWSLGSFVGDSRFKSIKSPRNIYDFVLKELSYSYDRLSKDTSRYGAEKALEEPSKAVCMEFTDLFVGLARERGIYAREVQGYGYSEKENIRPLSLITDVLHSWPEYYDEQLDVWHSIDPTWEDTSGIDYFTGFDVNHIALAIHGRTPNLPLPAGFYKAERSKDVIVSIAKKKPKATDQIEVENTIKDEVGTADKTSAKILVTNTGNAYIHELQILPEAKNIVFDGGSIDVGLIAPFQTKEIEFFFKPRNSSASTDTIKFQFDGETINQKTVAIVNTGNNFLELSSYVLLGLAIIGAVLLFINRRA